MPPTATYRVQFSSSFGFRDAKEIIGYLKDLGVSDLYASPIFAARPGSLHGYDVIDPNRLNPELGSAEDFDALISGAASIGLGWVQDVVSNHMAYDGGNALLMDIFEKGHSSRYLNFFDTDWNHSMETIKGRILAPFLGRIYGEALEAGEIRLAYGRDGFSVSYYGFKFPVRIDSYASIISLNLKDLKKRLGPDNPEFIKLLGVLYVLKNLASNREFDEIYDQVAFIKRLLWELYSRSPDIKAFFDANVTEYNGSPGEPESFNHLDRLLSEQAYKFSFWKVAAEEINYRRFFNINELITLKVESDEVFDHVHSLVLSLLGKGVTGIRIDHIDGLYCPLKYLEKLRRSAKDAYIVVEKILAEGERLPQDWPVEGTTGYDFLNVINGLFCDQSNEGRLSRIYSIFIRQKLAYSELVYQKKKLITELDMTSDAINIAQLLKLTLRNDRFGSDITFSGLKRAVVEVMSFFPVYRTYISSESVRESDGEYIREAVAQAISRNPALYNELKYLERVLTLKFRDYFTDEERKEWLHFAMKFQQFTGPLMAKGFEDTLLYAYNRLMSLNEVGGNPGRFGCSIEDFHVFNLKRAISSPHTMNATSTHDTKRGEDVRARINVLSEIPSEWETRVRKWELVNRPRKAAAAVPDRNDEYFLYQTLAGAFPFEGQATDEFIWRIKAYIIKAVREAKIHTAWLKPDTEYEEGFLSFIDKILGEDASNFLNDFILFQKKVSWYGMLNSLSQTLIKITSPGIPDFYQGTELWDLSLVDPDNRRPVDFKRRAAALDSIKEAGVEGRASLIPELLSTPEDGRVKLFVIHSALKARLALKGLFERGAYIPLETRGRFKDHLIAFLRTEGSDASLTAAPRLMAKVFKERQYPVGAAWEDTELLLPNGAPEAWKDVFDGAVSSGRSLPAKELLHALPVALLTAEA